MQCLLDHDVTSKRGVSNAHQEPAYADPTHWLAAPGELAVSERLRDTTILLPLFHAMTDPEMARLIDVLSALDLDLGGA